jgi:predicted transport protein
MSDLKLFRITAGKAAELDGQAMGLEKSLQTLIEENLEEFLGVTFLASERSTGPKHGGRIDTLGIDENGSPVIIEYKRALHENVINQGLYYLDWLMDHRAEFELLVMKEIGKHAADGIDWTGPRLLCIAGAFTKYDEHAVQQINRNIELIRYRRFGDDLLVLELVNAVTVQPTGGIASPPPGKTKAIYKTVTDFLAQIQGTPLHDLYEEVKAYLESLGDDVQVKTLKFYVAVKRIKNFACVEVHPKTGEVLIYVKVDPDSVTLEEDFTRDVRKIGHFGTGDLEIRLTSREDLERAKPLLNRSYEAS